MILLPSEARHVTIVASMWLTTGMNSFMILKRLFINKSITTKIEYIWFIVGMRSHDRKLVNLFYTDGLHLRDHDQT